MLIVNMDVLVMGNSLLIIVLALATLGLVLVVGFYEFRGVRQHQKQLGEKPGGIAGPSQ
jgi:hypothetical protein